MTEEKSEKRKIDRIRDSAGMFTVGDESDGAVKSLATIGGRLYAIKDKAIYTVALADDIDPERSREDIPNTVQKVFDLGSSDEIVIRSLLTGIELFRKDRLQEPVDYEAALTYVFNVLRDLISAFEISGAVDKFIAKERENSIKPKGGAVALPSYPALYAEVKNFIQKLDHAMQNIFNLACVFYGEETLRKAGKWLDGLACHLAAALPPGNDFIGFARELANFGKMVRNNRHCIEHPRPTQRIELHDYRITATRELLEPSIAVVHDETPVDLTPVDQFMHFFNEQALAGTELLMVFLAGHHLAPLGQFQIGVGEVPEEQRRVGVRFGYLINFNGKPQRLGLDEILSTAE